MQIPPDAARSRYCTILHDPDTARYRTRATRLRYRTAPVPHHYGMVSQGQSCAYRYRTIPIPHDADTARCRYRTMPIPHDADTDADTALEHSTMVWYPRGSHVCTDTARYRTIPIPHDTALYKCKGTRIHREKSHIREYGLLLLRGIPCRVPSLITLTWAKGKAQWRYEIY